MKTLQEWLDWCEQLHPVAIDMGLDRVKTVAERMALRFDCPVITVAGTNGKGSTCAMLEAIAFSHEQIKLVVQAIEDLRIQAGLGT